MFKIRRICSRYTFVLSFDVVLTATCRTLINPSHSTAHQCRCGCRIKSDLAVVTLHANGMHSEPTVQSYLLSGRICAACWPSFFGWSCVPTCMQGELPVRMSQSVCSSVVGLVLCVLRSWACWVSIVWNVDVFSGWGLRGESRRIGGLESPPSGGAKRERWGVKGGCLTTLV